MAEEIAEKTARKAAEKVPSWIKSVLLPEFNEIKSELKAVNARIDSLDERMNTRVTSSPF